MFSLKTLRVGQWWIAGVAIAYACGGTSERDPGGGAASTGGGSGSGGSASGASGSGGSITLAGSGGAAGTGTFVGTGATTMTSTPSDGGACQEFKLDLVPKIPTVFVLVDRSGSMFKVDSKTMKNSWDPLKAATLAVIQGTQDKVRYGFGAFTGENGQTCPMFDKVDINLNNYSAIEAKYNTLMPPTKGETPTMKVLVTVADLLKADTNDGTKNILFVTDGDPDYCDDGNPYCPVDSTVAVIQRLYKQGINTFVLGIQSSATTASNDALQEFANAGLGQPVLPPQMPNKLMPLDIYNQCSGIAGWKADAMAAGTPAMQPLATYSTTNGAAPLYKPEGGNQQALQDAIQHVVQGLKSCVLDLPANFEVDLANLGEAKVLINSQEVAQGDNGWRMNSKTQLEFVGMGCELWKLPTSNKLITQFPCVYEIAR